MSRQYLRYRKEADSRFLRGHRALLAALKHDAGCAGDDDGDDGGEDAGVSPAVTTEPAAAAAAAAGTTDKVDSPNDPGNGRTAATVPPAPAPAGAGGLVVLVLLALLLGQLLGGLGQVNVALRSAKERSRAWAATLGAEPPRAVSGPFATAPDLQRRDR
jgi:hypothetical protein